MGLFSSTYITRVGTVVSRVCADKFLPNSIRSGGLRAIVKDQNIPETLLDEMGGSIALKAEQMYSYAKQHYTHGLPSGQFSSAIQGRAEVTAVLNAIYGGGVDLDYSHYQPPNMQHTGWMKLVQDHGYNPTTNQLANLSATKGAAVYLDDMTLVIPESQFASYSLSALEQWGEPATAGFSPSRKYSKAMGYFLRQTPVTRDDFAVAPHIKVDYCWILPNPPGLLFGFVPEPTIAKGSFTMSVASYADTADYFQVKFYVGEETRYWMYKGGSGAHPTLDAVFIKTPAVNGSFYPFTYFRYNKVSEISNKTTAAYKTSKKLVKYIRMNYDQVAEAVDHNPGIANVEQAMLIMAVPANSTDPLEKRYLFKFFDNLFSSNANQHTSLASLAIAQSQANGNDLARSTLVIQDKRFKMALTNDGLTKRRVAGSIGKVGTHTFFLDETTITRSYLNGVTLEYYDEQYQVKVHVYRKQVSYRIYEEIRVVALQMLYFVYQDYIATGDENDAILLIPIDRSIISTYSLPDRETLFSRSMHYVFNSVVITEVKWYQSDFFQFVMIAVAVYVFITSGIDLTSLASALVSGSSAAIIAAVTPLLVKLLISMAISALLKVVAKALGMEATLVIALIAAVASGYIEFAGGVEGAPWVDQLLQLATGLTNAVSHNLQDMFKDLAKDFDTLAAMSEEANKALTTANKLLENNNYLSPIVIFGETPNDFYNRTIHSGNVGITAIGAISSYVDTALTLPKLAETLGESPYD